MWKNNGRKCKNTEEEMTNIKELINITHQALEEIGLDHFVLYGR